MNNYIVIKLDNGNKYISIDYIDYLNNKYFLLSKIDENNNISNNLEIVLYNTINNYFEELDDEVLYNDLKTKFQQKLDFQKFSLEIIDSFNNSNLVKLVVVKKEISNFYLIDKEGNNYIKNIDILGSLSLEVGDYIYISKNTLENNNILQYGPIHSLKYELIKIIRNDQEYYLQRYFG